MLCDEIDGWTPSPSSSLLPQELENLIKHSFFPKFLIKDS